MVARHSAAATTSPTVPPRPIGVEVSPCSTTPAPDISLREAVVRVAADHRGVTWAGECSGWHCRGVVCGTWAICKCWWAGVRCDAPVAAGREVARGDQTIGMAAPQAAARPRASIARRRVRARRRPDLGNIRGGVVQAPAPGQRPRSAAAYPVSPPAP
jgi:hypothetical protein